MDKINNKLAMALLRGVIVIGGLMATVCVALFMESLSSCGLTLLVGAIIVTLVDESINKLKL